MTAKQKIWGFLAIAAAIGAAMSARGGNQPSYIAHEIMIDGPALFYEASADSRRELWAIDCSAPLRGCVARADGIALRLDENGAPWLLAAAPFDARISIQTRNMTQQVKDIFASPLSQRDIAQLSKPQSFLVIENAGRVVLRTKTTAVASAISYLQWLQSPTGRTLRDARLWPETGPINTEAMEPDVLGRYEILQRRYDERQRQIVPNTKPQIEFAIQAQGGASYYSATGDAGY